MILRRDNETRANRHVEEESFGEAQDGELVEPQQRNQPFFSFPTGGRIESPPYNTEYALEAQE